MLPSTLPATYLNLLQTTGLGAEAYKWELLRNQRGRPNLGAANYGAELLDLDFSNLIYPQTSLASLTDLAKFAPDALLALHHRLFDEDIPLDERLAEYRQGADEAFAKTREDNRTAAQDERTAATLLFFRDASRYTLYKNSVYKNFCSLLGVQARSAGEKYAHYLDLLRIYVEEHVLPNDDLIASYRSLVPDVDELDPNRLLLAQDMLYRVLEQGKGNNFSRSARRYWRVGTSAGDTGSDYWSEMQDREVAALGWKEVTDISQLGEGDPQKADIIEQMTTQNYYPGDKRTTNRKSGELFKFFAEVSPGDVLMAQAGEDIRGVGVVEGDYSFDGAYDFSHQRPVSWQLVGNGTTNSTGLRTSFYELTDPALQSKIEALLSESAQPKPNSPHPLNQILYGPPGTGKTYRTRQTAVEICDGTAPLNRRQVRDRYRELVNEGRITFTTFHPSLSYEDFVEGIKPDTTDAGEVTYRIEPGIFYNQCVEAFVSAVPTPEDDKSVVFTQQLEAFYDDVATRLDAEQEILIETRTGNKMRIVATNDRGNFVLEHVDGSREYTVSQERLVRLWNGLENFEAVRNINQEFRAVIGGSNASAMWAMVNAVRQFEPSSAAATRVLSTSSKGQLFQANVRQRAATSEQRSFASLSAPPHVLIIDEINRGNTPAIFGELITLLEADKRLGAEEELTVTLPYSKQPFGVPANLHIVATMNTADRSVEALDAALRRRFEFTEVAPDPEVLATAGHNGGLITLDDGSELSLIKFLEQLNNRIIALRDRDHAIGHAHFISVDGPKALCRVLAKAVIPLLQEYFFKNDAQLALILGKGFVEQVDTDVTFAASDNETPLISQRYKLVDLVATNFSLARALEAGGFIATQEN